MAPAKQAQKQAQPVDPNRPTNPDKAAEYDADMAEFERQTAEVEARDGGAGIRTTDLPAQDTQVHSVTPPTPKATGGDKG